MTRIKPDFIFDATTTTITKTIQENGFVELVAVVVPNFTNAVTATVTVKDVDGIVIWTKSAIAKGATALFGSGPDAAEMGCIPFDYGYSVTVTLSGAAGGTGGTVYVAFYCKSMGMGE